MNEVWKQKLHQLKKKIGRVGGLCLFETWSLNYEGRILINL